MNYPQKLECSPISISAALDLLHDPDLAFRFGNEALELSPESTADLLCPHAGILLVAQSAYDEAVTYSQRCIDGAELLDDRLAGQVFALSASFLAGKTSAAGDAATALIDGIEELGAKPLDWPFASPKHALEQQAKLATSELIKLLEALSVSDPALRRSSAEAALRAALLTNKHP